MTNDGILSSTVLNSWKLIISRFDKILGDLTEDQLQREIAPGKNRIFYLLGHLTATHDRMFPLLGIGERLHPELDDAYITNPDKVLGDPLSATELRRAWAEVNDKLTRAFEEFTLEDWLQKHTAVSDEDFIKDPIRNRLAVVMNRTSHASYHAGQAALTK
jgi:DinB superfamily